jgi:NAD(P)-dependent dehydrogenase (short-subunit alcohol dehydrogenase family)
LPSPHVHPTRAADYSRHRYRFDRRTLAERTVLLAGGTGGLGPALASLLLSEGARVLLAFRSNSQRAESVAANLEQETGRRPELIRGDITNAAGRRSVLDAGGEQLYGLVVLVGDPARVAPEALGDEAIAASLALNYSGPILLARDALERMAGSGTAGSVVLFSTMQAVRPFPGSLAYAGPKAALIQAARILAKQHRGQGLRVNVLAPGVTMAGMAEASIARGKYDSYIEQQIIARFGYPEDIARAARLFLEPDNYLTGQLLVIDGGLTL